MNNDNLSGFKPFININDEELNFTNNKSEGSIFDLANAFLSIQPMTHKKLQKLCYYAKAWYLALYDENLISENFEAWVHGAVQPTLYRYYRAYGFQLIPAYSDNVSRLPETFLSFAYEIFSSYGHLSGDELERLNHKEEPWVKAREGIKPWENCRKIISEDDMKTYYRKLLQQ